MGLIPTSYGITVGKIIAIHYWDHKTVVSVKKNWFACCRRKTGACRAPRHALAAVTLDPLMINPTQPLLTPNDTTWQTKSYANIRGHAAVIANKAGIGTWVQVEGPMQAKRTRYANYMMVIEARTIQTFESEEDARTSVAISLINRSTNKRSITRKNDGGKRAECTLSEQFNQGCTKPHISTNSTDPVHDTLE